MPTRVPVLVVTAYLLLGSAWVVGNPPGAAPDEYAHYLKALAAGRGQLYLDRHPEPPANVETLETTARWHLVTSRIVRVPAGLDPSPLLCTAFRPEVSAACLDRARPGGPTEGATIVGPYQPFTYVLPGLLMRLADDPENATRFGRLGFWLFSAGLLGLTTYLLWSPGDGGYSLVGLLVTATPMVVFMVSTLSANGLEIGAGVCFLAAVIRLARGGEDWRWVWAAACGSGALLALSRVTGVLWLALAGVTFVTLVGVRPAVAILRRGGRRAACALVVIGTAVAGTLAWELAVQPRPQRSAGAAVRGLRQELEELPDVFEQAIGIFGWLDTSMTRSAYRVWTVLLVTLLALALVVAGRRQRLVLCGLAVGSVVVTVAIATLNRPTGFGVQGRYVLPFVTVVPLVAGEMLFANRHRLRGRGWRGLPLLFAATVAAVHLSAWYSNARRYAVGARGPLLFLDRAEWSPPLGWETWFGVVVLAVSSLVVAALVSIDRRLRRAAHD